MKNAIKLSIIWTIALLVGGPMQAFAQMKTLVDVNKSFSGITKIEVSGGALEVEFIGNNNSEVKVNAFLESNNHEQDIVFVTVGNVLKITHQVSSNRVTIGNMRTKGHIKISGPQKMELDIKGGSGAIHVENVVSEKTQLSVGSGRISGSNINSNIHANAGSGSIKLSGITGNIKGIVGSGSSEFADIKGDLEFSCSSGGMKATSIAGTAHISLTSGNAKLENVSELGDLKVTSGNFNAVNVGLGDQTRISGTSGNFKIQTSSNLNDFNYFLSATSGNITVGNSRAGRNLNIDNGSTKTIRGGITSGNITIVNH
ncbi:DUF4097 family beta strand repeat-containing protein [Cecembia rubra]|uniref:Putative adhesin n=1 Tax=Cecembia rubra TaxID=1485585 RepID=A0A2P8EA77_9BACT|nr:DUF4097 family beta strand repeat-containing protein [Cecembia rubra]PSL06381.1 putative adhesin [Cecembia rubra]